MDTSPLAAQGSARRPYVLPLAVLLAGAATFLCVAWLLERAEDQRLRSRFQAASRDRVTAIEREVKASLETLLSVHSFFGASTHVQREEFDRFVLPLLKQQRQILAMEWAPRVPADARQRYEAEARADGLANFTILQRVGNRRQFVPAEPRDEYYPIFYAQPRAINREVMGLDLWSDPDRRQALQRARSGGGAIASSPVLLVQDQERGYMLCMPVFGSDRNGDAAGQQPAGPAAGQRQAEIQGFLVAVLRTSDLIEDATAGLNPQPVDLFVYDAQADEPLLHVLPWKAGREPNLDEAGQLQYRDTINLAGQPLEVLCVAAPEFASASRTAQPLWVLIVGVLLSGIGAAFVHVLQHRNQVVSQLVARRTEQLHQSQAALSQEKQLLHAIIDNVAEGIVVADVDGKYILRNSAAVRLLGPTLAEVSPETVSQHYAVLSSENEDPIAGDELPLARATRGESVDDMELLLRSEHCPDGIWLSACARPVWDDRGELRGGVVLFRDVTQRRENERRIRAMNQHLEERVQARTAELERSNQELQQFAFIASHDLKEPLRKVRMFGDRLKEKYGSALDAKAVDYLERMRGASGRMENLLNALLSYSRVTTKGQPVHDVPLNDVVHDVLSDLEMRLQETGAQVQVGDLPVVQGDRPQLRQLLQNLIANGIKFHKPDNAPIVKISSEILRAGEAGQPLCRITVRDEGIGFDMKYAQRIFAPFQRLHGQSAYEGTGMGLAICRKIVERHNGRITVESVPGQGTSFTVELPLAAAFRSSESCETQNAPSSPS